jgi:hypothetical protein
MEQGEQRPAEQRPAWVIKRQLNADALKEYVARFGIDRAQVVAITEPQDGMFTLIYEPTDAQQTELAAAESQVAETLDVLFGAPVTPPQDPVEGAVVVIPAVAPGPAGSPESVPLAVPFTEPSPS